MGLARVLAESTAERSNRPAEDHFHTPAYAVAPLLPYIPKSWHIWECTDTYGDSEIARTLSSWGCSVKSTCKDVIDFTSSPQDLSRERIDLIITNPPFNKKDEFIEACVYYEYRYSTKWALLLPLTALEGKKRHELYGRMIRPLELMIFDKRIEYLGKSVWFNTAWFTSGLLGGGQLHFEKLDKNWRMT